MKKLLIPCCLLLLTNCVDNKYDKEIDMNVTIAENGISIPIGETDKFTLSKLISTDDNLKINGDSVYYISESTRSTTEFAAIQSVAIDQSNGLAPNIEPTKILLPEEVISAVENGIKFNTSIPLTLSADVPVDPSELNISKEIERIDTILFDAPKEAVLTITTEIYEEQGPANSALQLSDMTMSLPHMLMLAPSGNIGDVTLEATDDNGNPLAIRDHVLYIPQKNAEKGIFTISVKIYGLCGGEIRPDGTNDFLLLPSTEDENILDIVNNKFTLDGNALSLVLPLPGAFNVCNFLGAFAVAFSLGIPLPVLLRAVGTVPRVPGRLQPIPLKSGAVAYVDYAHTDDALFRVLTSLRAILPAGGRILTVFGCGGDRDRSKRPRMGAVAAKFSDMLFLTSDNPRSEDPAAILRDIESGIPQGTVYEAIPDRAEAIARAIAAAGNGDLLLVAGKGHETYQEIRGKKIRFSDAEQLVGS